MMMRMSRGGFPQQQTIGNATRINATSSRVIRSAVVELSFSAATHLPIATATAEPLFSNAGARALGNRASGYVPGSAGRRAPLTTREARDGFAQQCTRLVGPRPQSGPAARHRPAGISGVSLRQ